MDKFEIGGQFSLLSWIRAKFPVLLAQCRWLDVEWHCVGAEHVDMLLEWITVPLEQGKKRRILECGWSKNNGQIAEFVEKLKKVGVPNVNGAR